MPDARSDFFTRGEVTDHIKVEISLQIISLFSEGLYSSPNKAIEELVSNAFDADATRVHVAMSADRAADGATIVVLDNGTGMDTTGLKIHWIVGDSVKSKSGNRRTARGRRAIGKFGIGKLAAYVLGSRLTHITKSNGKFYSTSMDFGRIPSTVSTNQLTAPKETPPPEDVILDLRELTEADAKTALAQWMSDGQGRTELKLFGTDAEPSWTAAIISDLKPMASDLSAGRLRWVLSTAMPLRDDFKLYLNETEVKSSRINEKRVGTWRLGKELVDLPKPAPDELEADVDPDQPEDSDRHWTVVDSLLGPISGYLEVFESPIDSGKAHETTGRNNGFFVYVHGRLVNPDDAGFGIDRNSLRHGTFSRFRAVVHIDRLDEELRSSRETLRAGPLLARSEEILRGIFNFARARLEAFQGAPKGKREASQRVQESPLGLTERPVVRMLVDAFDDPTIGRHLVNARPRSFETKEEFVAELRRLIEERGIFEDVSFEDLGTGEPMAVLDVFGSALRINLEHPFVAHFSDEFGDSKKNLPLQLFAVSEILLEAQLFETGIDSETVSDVLDVRDELLRELARSSGIRNSLTVAQALIQSATSDKELEAAVVDAFRQLGFEAVPKGKKDESDGLAEAHLPGSTGSRPNRYRVSLEAKSKQSVGAKVKKKDVEVSTIARHRDESNCDHAVVVGPDFETGSDDLGAVMREIADDRQTHEHKSITLIRVTDLAKLVRIAPTKRLNLMQLRDLFRAASSPNEARTWIDTVEAIQSPAAPYAAILEAVWAEQEADPANTVEYSQVRAVLRITKNLQISDADLRAECLALSRMAPTLFAARDDRVELNTRPDKVLEAISEYVNSLPEENQE